MKTEHEKETKITPTASPAPAAACAAPTARPSTEVEASEADGCVCDPCQCEPCACQSKPNDYMEGIENSYGACACEAKTFLTSDDDADEIKMLGQDGCDD